MVYKCNERLGLINIEGLLVNIMIDAIRDNLPIIKQTVEDELATTRTLLHSLEPQLVIVYKNVKHFYFML